ncbi:hypothetical protein ACI7BZ_00150 [Xanthobacter sp. AM11]|uniref:hypothetical protein n=1 Tax=Xanthobacter sp. AM11 TaxID=3380643 RepID=UPI0039BF19A6
MPAHKHKHKTEHKQGRDCAPAKARPAVPDPHGGVADYPAAGPHARPELMDPDRTPGAGALADPRRPQDADSTG